MIPLVRLASASGMLRGGGAMMMKPPRVLSLSTVSGEGVRARVEALVKENPVMVFSKSMCPFCMRAKTALEESGVSFGSFELDTHQDGPAMQQALLDMTGQRTVPNVFVEGKHLGGSDDVVAAVQEGRLPSK